MTVVGCQRPSSPPTDRRTDLAVVAEAVALWAKGKMAGAGSGRVRAQHRKREPVAGHPHG
jgi:hypothetical protein